MVLPNILTSIFVSTVLVQGMGMLEDINSLWESFEKRPFPRLGGAVGDFLLYDSCFAGTVSQYLAGKSIGVDDWLLPDDGTVKAVSRLRQKTLLTPDEQDFLDYIARMDELRQKITPEFTLNIWKGDGIVFTPEDKQTSVTAPASKSLRPVVHERTVALGDEIVVSATPPQPPDVFTLQTYREHVRQIVQLSEELRQIHAVLQTYPMKKRSRGSKSNQFDRISSQINSLSSTYIQRLPIMMLAQCPYCATYIWQPVDVFSLMGLGAYLQAEKIYRGNDEWYGLSLYRQLCSHALCATLAINLNGRMPDDLVGWMIGETIPTINYLTLEPRLMVWPLVARHTSAVLRVLPIGRLDDDIPRHHYTAYFVTYFAANDTDLYTQKLWVNNDAGGPATGGVQTDANLLKWVRAGRLHWMDSDNNNRMAQGPAEEFPYAKVRPQGEFKKYKILKNGQVDFSPTISWEGHAPEHDDSFTCTIE
jgi:hypothetical protein